MNAVATLTQTIIILTVANVAQIQIIYGLFLLLLLS